MKKLMKLSFVLVAAMFFSCSDDDNNGGGSGNQYLRFTAQGNDYDLNPETLSSLETIIFGFEGDGTDYRRVSLWMPNDVTVGSHEIQNTALGYTASYETGDIVANATSGTLVVTSNDGNIIKGTFSFTAEGSDGEGTYEVTNGSFRADAPTDPTTTRVQIK